MIVKLTKKRQSHISMITLLTVVFLFVSVAPFTTYAEFNIIPEQDERGWVDFILVCNEGMSNTGGNVGNTMMVVSMSPKTGKIRLMMLTWDTFIKYKRWHKTMKAWNISLTQELMNECKTYHIN